MLPAALGLASSLGSGFSGGRGGPSSATATGGTVTLGNFSPGIQGDKIVLAVIAVGALFLIYTLSKK